jgi:hypothetical protein
LTAGKGRYIPAPAVWLELDADQGREMFYVLVSSVRLARLEDLIQARKRTPPRAGAAKNDPVLEEITRLRAAYAAPESDASRPVTVTGGFRSTLPELAAVANEVKAPRLYARTYIVEHQ